MKKVVQLTSEISGSYVAWNYALQLEKYIFVLSKSQRDRINHTPEMGQKLLYGNTFQRPLCFQDLVDFSLT